jgi:hypothetical protein
VDRNGEMAVELLDKLEEINKILNPNSENSDPTSDTHGVTLRELIGLVNAVDTDFRERRALHMTDEKIVPYGGSTGCVIGARKIHELAEPLAKN